jgi:imidazolonepropionase-like amidohydrolase
LFVRAGLTPLQALQAATLSGAEFLDRAETNGSVAVGKAADLVLLKNNPLKNIEATRAIHAVVLKGVVYERGELDAMLKDVEKKVARGAAGA